MSLRVLGDNDDNDGKDDGEDDGEDVVLVEDYRS